MASFVRQLNMYGFHKVIALHSGNLKVRSVSGFTQAHIFSIFEIFLKNFTNIFLSLTYILFLITFFFSKLTNIFTE